MKKIIITIIVVAVIGLGLFIIFKSNKKATPVPVVNTGNETGNIDITQVTTPQPNTVVTSPLVVKGQAPGNWFFEASFPVMLVDSSGNTIAQGPAKADGDWMTTDLVPFEATLTFTNPQDKNNGTLILKKDNPSGLPQNDDSLEIPITFGK